MIDRLVEFCREAGAIAIAGQAGIDYAASRRKSARAADVVTRIDETISANFAAFARREFRECDYLIFDEESVGELGANPWAKIAHAEYVFIIDPIDGTLPYAARLPFFSLSIGVFQRGAPVAGIVYAPALRELLYADARQVWHVTDAFLPNAVALEIAPPLLETNPPLFAFNPLDARLTDDDAIRALMPINLYSGALNGLYLATARLRGWVFYAFPWDIAGIYAIFARLGVTTCGLTSGRTLDIFARENFQPNLRVREPYICCLPRDRELFCRGLAPTNFF